MYVDRDCKATSVVASRAWYGITQYKMASNIQLTTGRDREIAGLILLFRTAIRGCFVLGTARVKALGCLKKKKKEEY